MTYAATTGWSYLGLVNEPCFKKATGPDPEPLRPVARRARSRVPARSVRERDEVPGVQIGARGKTVPVGSYYGEPTGVVGLRLFPNPAFDEEARKKWDSERYYRDPSYYESRDLVKPYRVGMSCGFCHVGPNPVKPPADPENPRWENLSSNVGAQYLLGGSHLRLEGRRPTRRASSIQLFHTSLPGHARHVARLDRQHQQSAHDERGLLPRAAHGAGEEVGQGDAGRRRPRTTGSSTSSCRRAIRWRSSSQPPSTTWTPRVLKDGSDSVGALGALNRVYLNIGLFSEEWLLALPAAHRRHSRSRRSRSPTRERTRSTGRRTELQTPNMARFFLAQHRRRTI